MYKIPQTAVELETNFKESSMNFNEFIDTLNEFIKIPPKAPDHEVVQRRSRPTPTASDREAVRRRSRPTTKWSDSKPIHVEMVMSSDADSFEIEFVRVSAFQIAVFCRISTPKRCRNRDFE